MYKNIFYEGKETNLKYVAEKKYINIDNKFKNP